MDRPIRVVIVNGFGDGNLGGAAITLAAGDLAREVADDVEVSLVPVSSAPEFLYNRRVQPDVEILPPAFDTAATGRFRRLCDLAFSVLWAAVPALAPRRGAFAALRSADVVLAKGGFVFRQRHGLSGYLAGWFTMWPYLFGRRSGAVAVAYSASIGPFRTAPSRALSRLVLRRSHLVCCRDEDSARRLRDDLHHHGPTDRMSDCVFGLEGDPRLVPGAADGSAGKVLALVPRRMAPTHWRAFVDACRLAVEHQDWDRIVVVQQSSDDPKACTAICEELHLDPSCIEAPAPDEAVAIYRQASLVVTGRLHGAIFSVLAGTPLLMIDIAKEVGKSQPVLADVGLDWALLPTDAPPDQVRAALDRALDPATAKSIPAQLAPVAASVRAARARTVEAIRARLPH